MRSEIISHREICERILGVYRDMLGSAYYGAKQGRGGLTLERIRFIEDLQQQDRLSRSSLSEDDIWTFFKILQDSAAISLATGGQTLFVKDATLFGSEKKRRQRLLKQSDSQIRDWHFSVLVQAHAKLKGLTGLQDLDLSPKFDDSKVCDFRLRYDTGHAELLECKRMHPHRSRAQPVSFESLEMEVYEKLEGAVVQLNQTAAKEDNVQCRHALVEVSDYWKPMQIQSRRIHGATVVGFHEEHIEALGITLNEYLPSSIDVNKVTLCWSNLIFVDDIPLALVQLALSPHQTSSAQCQFDYGGWTTEAYPRYSKGPVYHELRLSSTARSIAQIVTTFNNLVAPDTFYTVGEEKRLLEE